MSLMTTRGLCVTGAFSLLLIAHGYGEMTDYECKPTTLPVSGCDCPNSVAQDWCFGQLPKPASPGYYGDVSCQVENGETCNDGTDMNPCGDTYYCPNTTCPSSFYFPNACQKHEEKPPCTGNWGSCEYVYPS